MPIVVNSNVTATTASFNLSHANDALRKSLSRLSSGKRIVSPADDAGGMAVAYKLQSKLKRTEAVRQNIQNGISYLQVQDGALSNMGKILDRMSELKTLAADVTKNATDVANYDTEFDALKSQLTAIGGETFNGVSLFSSGSSATTLSVATTESGGSSVTINQAALGNAVTNATSATDLADVSLAQITTAIENVATLRAQNGAQSSQLSFASDMLTVNKQNLEAANSRIIDVDVATESTQLARANILVQAGTAMLGQANASSAIALRLLGQ